MHDSPEETYGLDPQPARRRPAPPTQPQPFIPEPTTGDTMLDEAIHRKRASLAVQRDVDDLTTRAYLTPVIMFLCGVTIACGLRAFAGPEFVVGYLLSLGVSVPTGVGVYFLFCLMWIGFDAPIHLIALRLAGIFAVTDATQTLLGLIPGIGFFLAIPAGLIVYFGLLMHMLEVEMVEAFVIGMATWFVRFILIMAIALAL